MKWNVPYRVAIITSATLILGDHAVVAAGGSRARAVLETGGLLELLLGHLVDAGLES